MQAIVQTHCGKPEVLTLTECPPPTIRAHEVLVKNLATSVNPRDCLIRAGRYQLQFMLPKTPFIPGSDCYGRVLECGPAVSGLRPGDLVLGLKNPSHGLGCYAQQVAISANQLAKAPSNLSAEQVAGVPLCALTAWQALVELGEIQAGQRILIIGASGGVGHLAVQIARHKGAVVEAMCSEKNATLVQSLGANTVYDYHSQTLSSLQPQYDVIFDTIGQSQHQQAIKKLNPQGIFVTTVPSMQALVKTMLSRLLTVIKIPHRRSRVVMVKPSQSQLAEISKLLTIGAIKPVVDSVYAMADIAQAHLRSQSRRAVGKIIIRTE